MRVSSSDKTEIIRLVEQSHLPARRTLECALAEHRDKMNAIVQGQTEMAHTLSRKMVENASNDIMRIRAS